MSDYPNYVCTVCAIKAGGSIPIGDIASWHMGICPCCGHLRRLTSPKFFKYPKLEVLHEYREATESLGHRHGIPKEDDLAGSNGPEGKAEQSQERIISEI